MHSLSSAALWFMFLMTTLSSSTAAAQGTYPTRPITMVNPLAPGGGLDVIGRKLASKVGAELGQPVLMDNKPGASGTIAANTVAKAAPDGYTLLIAPGSTMSILPHVLKRMSYRTTDFTPVAQVGTTPFVLAIKGTDPSHTLAQFVAAAKANPTSVSYGSNGNATLGHLLGESLKKAAGMDMLHVPYKGSAPAVTDLLAGQVTAIATDLATVRPYLQSGSLRVLAITGKTRNAAFPSIPTFTEAGFPALEPMTGSITLWAPAHTPGPVVDKLVKSVTGALQDAEVRSTLSSFGYEATGLSPTALEEFTKQDTARWGKIVQSIGGLSLD